MIHTENLATQRVGDIVSDNYHTAGVFKELGIDFCCGGGKPLIEVCEKKGLSLNEVVQKLNAIPWQGNENDHNYKEWDAVFLIDYIINTHHQFVRRKTEEISMYAAKVARVHGERHPENADILKCFTTLSNELIEHLEAEENTVFPLIKTLSEKQKSAEPFTEDETNELKYQLSLMVDDHDGAGELMAKIRDLSHDFTPPEGACRTYEILYQNLAGFEADLHKHVHLENNILFKKAESLLKAG